MASKYGERANGDVKPNQESILIKVAFWVVKTKTYALGSSNGSKRNLAVLDRKANEHYKVGKTAQIHRVLLLRYMCIC